MLTFVVSVLLAEGYTTRTFSGDQERRTGQPATGVPREVTDGGPLMPAWPGVLAVQTLCAACAFRLDGENLRPLWALPLQRIVHRRLMYLVLVQACLTAVNGCRLP